MFHFCKDVKKLIVSVINMMVLFRMIYQVYTNLQASFGCTEVVQTKHVLCTVAQNQWMVIIELLPHFGRSKRKYK